MIHIGGTLPRHPAKPMGQPWAVSIAGDVAALSGAMLAVTLTVVSIAPTVAGLAEARGGRYFALAKIRKRVARKLDALNICMVCFLLAIGLSLWAKALGTFMAGVGALVPFAIGTLVVVWAGWGIAGTAKDLLLRRGDE
jgi:hypothetical protein